MKTLTKNQKKTAKTPKPSTPDRLAAFKALSASRLDALRVALKTVKEAERRLDKILGELDALAGKCHDGSVTPNETADQIHRLVSRGSDVWILLEDTQFDLQGDCMMTVNDFIAPSPNL
jgi:hypothetical protein